MYCERKTLDVCFRSLRQQAEILLDKHKGIDITVKEHKKKRTLEQNDWLWAVYENMADFFYAFGYFIDGIEIRQEPPPPKKLLMNLIHEYCKVRQGIGTTTKLSTKEIGEYIETIQRDMVQQTCGKYEAIYPPEKDYFEATHYEECTGKS